MGIIVSYEVIKDLNLIIEIENNKNSNFNIETFLNQNRAEIKSFSTFVKSWNPLYSLLGNISGNNIFDKLSEYKSSIESNEYTKIFTIDEVSILYEILKGINDKEIKISIENSLLRTKIARENGYNMKYIFDENSIYTEFVELKNAVNFAYVSESLIVQILYP
ncbi:hypothetical protein [Epilithonimonas lactis]|nr:hypothetical protein [Epilithonimonas lactis]SEP86180.1 hypothetical protein SAMN04488097_0891 [Epilithonimonas lactis]